ncbi:MAG: response regulator [candidate division Zixibacteria bacterium]|nr:response regulator [candidate division Zixibacteria bacterium]
MEEFDPIRVLVVDDEEVMRNLMIKILEKAGYKVATAGGGLMAKRVLAEQPIDIVLTDVKMPDVNGFDLLREIKADYPHVAVIMMTAYADAFTIKDALLAGADEYITKPFKHYEVTVVIERAYWRTQAGRNQIPNTNT